jgi:hypothetical protein
MFSKRVRYRLFILTLWSISFSVVCLQWLEKDWEKFEPNQDEIERHLQSFRENYTLELAEFLTEKKKLFTLAQKSASLASNPGNEIKLDWESEGEFPFELAFREEETYSRTTISLTNRHSLVFENTSLWNGDSIAPSDSTCKTENPRLVKVNHKYVEMRSSSEDCFPNIILSGKGKDTIKELLNLQMTFQRIFEYQPQYGTLIVGNLVPFRCAFLYLSFDEAPTQRWHIYSGNSVRAKIEVPTTCKLISIKCPSSFHSHEFQTVIIPLTIKTPPDTTKNGQKSISYRDGLFSLLENQIILLNPHWRESNFQKIGITVILMDSVSRPHFMRSMKASVHTLQRFNVDANSNHKTFIFNTFHGLGTNSPPNQTPLLAGIAVSFLFFSSCEMLF